MIKIKAKGLLFIGDPHLKSVNPKRRKDPNFTVAINGKIKQAMAIAKQNQLWPVFLGDLFDCEDDSDAAMLTGLIKALKGSPLTPITIVGNHEKKQNVLTDDTALAALREAEVIHTMEKQGIHAIVHVEMDGKKIIVGVGATPYGQAIPSSVMEEKEKNKIDVLVWITHHDLAFNGAYPGAHLIEEIEGVDVLVNGHMHKTTDPVMRGKMKAFNPGNITRMSIDCKDQEPSVWQWSPLEKHELKRHVLIHEKDIFNLAGSIFEESSPLSNKEIKEETQERNLLFALKLKENKKVDIQQTTDAEIFKESLEATCLCMMVDPEVKMHLNDLLMEVVDDNLNEVKKNGSDSLMKNDK